MAATEYEEMVVGFEEWRRNHFFGKYRGVVTNVEDPEKLGRIIAQVPEILHEEPSPWALPATPFAGSGHGLVLIPEVGDGVWIEFEGGDPSRPIWSGGWFGPNDLPASGEVKARALVTTAGHKFVLNDESKEIQLLHSGGAELKMTDSEITLTIGQAEFKMSADQISLKVLTSEITMTAADLTLKSGPKAQVKLSPAGTDVNNGTITVM